MCPKPTFQICLPLALPLHPAVTVAWFVIVSATMNTMRTPSVRPLGSSPSAPVPWRYLGTLAHRARPTAPCSLPATLLHSEPLRLQRTLGSYGRMLRTRPADSTTARRPVARHTTPCDSIVANHIIGPPRLALSVSYPTTPSPCGIIANVTIGHSCRFQRNQAEGNVSNDTKGCRPWVPFVGNDTERCWHPSPKLGTFIAYTLRSVRSAGRRRAQTFGPTCHFSAYV